MKKIYISMIALALVGFCKTSMAQTVSITFNLDMTRFITAGGTVADTLSVAGTFGTKGAKSIGNWNEPPLAGGIITNHTGNIWTLVVDSLIPTTEPSDSTGVYGSTDSLEFKFVNGKAWSDANEGASYATTSLNISCGATESGTGGYNRTLAIPAQNATFNCEWDTCGNLVIASVQNINVSPKLTISPNPASGVATISYSLVNSGKATLEIYNTLGQLMDVPFSETQNAFTNSNSINVSNLATGLYFVKLTVGNNFSVSKLNVVR